MSEKTKNRIISLIVIFPFLYYFLKTIKNVPFLKYNFKEIILFLVITASIIFILFNVFLKLSTGKIRYKKIFVFSVALMFCFSLVSAKQYGEFSLQSLFGLSNNFSLKHYENKIVNNIDGAQMLEISGFPSNISNVVINAKKDIDYEISFNIIMCSKQKCILGSNKNIAYYKDKKVLIIPNGYSIDKVIINSKIGAAWIDTIEFNNKETLTSNKISNMFIIWSILISFIFVFAYEMLKRIKTMVFYLKIKKNISKKINKENLKIHNVFFVTAIVMGLIFSFLIPVYNTPDELTHLKLTYDSFGQGNIYEQIEKKYICDSCYKTIYTSNEKVSFSEYLNKSKVKLDDYSFKKIKISSYSISHLPQTIGLLLGQILHLPIFWILFLGEFSGIIFYALIGYIILKKIPIKKNIMFLILLLPMSIQQYSSLSYDVLLNAMCFYVFAEFMEILYGENKFFDFKSLLNIMVPLIIILLIKPPYVLLGGLTFLIPFKKYNFIIHNKKLEVEKIIRNKYFYMFATLVGFFAVIIALKTSFAKMIIACILEPKAAIMIFINTLRQFKSFYISSLIANFGWLNTEANSCFIYSVLAFMLFSILYKKQKKEINTEPKVKIVMMIIFISVCLLIEIALLFGWTIPMSSGMSLVTLNDYREALKIVIFIDGVQGRYFIPILPLLFYIFDRKITKLSNKCYSLSEVLFYIIAFTYSIVILLFRFWI